MDWTQVLTIVGSNLVLFLWARSESRSNYRECRQLIDSIHQEMKDFHTKLALQDQEFKMRLCSIEERNKGGK